jgi:4-hydroxybenzoate polyprenyltransferase
MSMRWVLAWAKERFPLRNGLFFVLLYVTTILVARTAVTTGPIAFRAVDLLGVAALWSFFLLLRVFDEHKDFAADTVAHPERVLQRGLVTLPQLRVVGACAVVVQLGASLWFDRGVGVVTMWWAASFAWSLLMAREFFVSAWLRRHLLLYALSHMVVMLLVVGWVASIADPLAPSRPIVWALASLVFLAGLVFEVARKMRAPEDERPTADTYTGALGPWRASMLLATLAVATYLMAIAVVQRLGVETTIGAVAAGGLSILAVVTVMRFAERPTPRGAKLVEAAAGLAIMAAHLMIAAGVVSARAIVWR